MNLDQITTKCWILALFERDDGERLLLGDGWFDFKDSLQHFRPNTFANDVIELQGSDGQMLAGQVRRGAPQSFDGYIGDPITNRQTIEQHRREFLMFFRKRHHYKVVYIFPDGTAIQRKQGYITDAPSVPEIRQRFPEYHVALNFEDVNYYEYAENAQGEEIFSNIRDINISTAATGGLVWDNLGAVSDQMGWKDIATATGQVLAMTNPENIKAPIASFEMTGNTIQDGTPTPSAPVQVQTVTGRQTVTAMGKNILDYVTFFRSGTYNGITASLNDDGSITISGKPTSSYVQIVTVHDITNMLEDGATYSLSSDGHDRRLIGQFQRRPKDGSGIQYIDTISGNKTVTIDKSNNNYFIGVMTVTTTDWGNDPLTITRTFQFEKGSVTSFEPFKGQAHEINLGKNLIEPLMPTTTYNGVTCTNNGDGSFTLNGTATATATWRIEQSTGGGHDNLKPLNGTYTLSCKGVQTGVSLVVTQFNVWQIIGRVRNNETPSTFTTNLNDTLVYIAVTNGTTVNNVTVYPQLEEGSIASSFAPYFEPIELCKMVGNTTTWQDRIYKKNGKWWLHKEVGKVILDGSSSEDWVADGASAPWYRYKIPIAGSNSASYRTLCLSDHFYFQGSGSNLGVCMIYGGMFYCYPDQTLSTLSSFTTWLASNNVTVYYPLATPTTTEITNEEILEGLNSAAGLKLFPGQNNITDQTLSAQPTMTVQYYTAIGPGGGLVWESGEAGGATTIEASGLDSAFPLWTVPGPSTNPTLTNITTGQSITWQGTVPAGQTLEIDMDKQTATLAGANVYAFVSGDWIRIDPGSNRMTYVGTGATQASTLSWNNIVG